MMRVISSPSSSTTGLFTLIFAIAPGAPLVSLAVRAYCMREPFTGRPRLTGSSPPCGGRSRLTGAAPPPIKENLTRFDLPGDQLVLDRRRRGGWGERLVD